MKDEKADKDIIRRIQAGFKLCASQRPLGKKLTEEFEVNIAKTQIVKKKQKIKRKKNENMLNRKFITVQILRNIIFKDRSLILALTICSWSQN